jgi:hypothetical protein
MREFTKSMMSYTWAMTVFGAQQMLNIFSPQGQRQQHPATEAFNHVAQATREEMGDMMKATYRAGDNLQRGMVDLMFSALNFGAADPSRGAGADSDVRGGACSDGGAAGASAGAGQQTADVFRQGVRMVSQTAEAFGQAMRGGASRQGRRGDANPQSTTAGWGPVE